MKLTRTLANREGQLWSVEYRESERLTHIDGFLMTYQDLSCITLSSHLNEADKARGRAWLLDRLAETNLGASDVHFWYAADT